MRTKDLQRLQQLSTFDKKALLAYGIVLKLKKDEDNIN
jgi:hypothetical protein